MLTSDALLTNKNFDALKNSLVCVYRILSQFESTFRTLTTIILVIIMHATTIRIEIECRSHEIKKNNN